MINSSSRSLIFGVANLSCRLGDGDDVLLMSEGERLAHEDEVFSGSSGFGSGILASCLSFLLALPGGCLCCACLAAS